MTQKDKELLLKDLSARLPYNVVIRCTDSDTDYKCFLTTDILHEIQNGYEYYDYKPYLRPMSSMTEEEKEEFISFNGTDGCYIKTMDFCHKHHLDNRGLIPMGLALEAPEDMYKID